MLGRFHFQIGSEDFSIRCNKEEGGFGLGMMVSVVDIYRICPLNKKFTITYFREAGTGC